MAFLLRAMYSGRDFAWLFPRQDQTCFLEGHVRAFEHLGGVLHRLAYDNPRLAVAKRLAGSERVLTPRFAALCNHYLFEASFCRPATGHDKGGVEAPGKGIRLQHLVPIPTGDSLGAISRALLARLDAQAADRRNIEGRSVLDRCRWLPSWWKPSAPRTSARGATSWMSTGPSRLPASSPGWGKRWSAMAQRRPARGWSWRWRRASRSNWR